VLRGSLAIQAVPGRLSEVALRLKQKQTIWLTQTLFFISLTFVFGAPVTVPEGGVEKGQEFEVPYPTEAPLGKFKVRTGTRWSITRKKILLTYSISLTKLTFLDSTARLILLL
jgi:hypothetical protein